jgi:hypothetical protein
MLLILLLLINLRERQLERMRASLKKPQPPIKKPPPEPMKRDYVLKKSSIKHRNR